MYRVIVINFASIFIKGFSWIGCKKSDANIYGCCIGQNISGNKNFVSIANVWNEGDALPMAEKHFQKYNRSATLKEMKGTKTIFNCID